MIDCWNVDSNEKEATTRKLQLTERRHERQAAREREMDKMWNNKEAEGVCTVYQERRTVLLRAFVMQAAGDANWFIIFPFIHSFVLLAARASCSFCHCSLVWWPCHFYRCDNSWGQVCPISLYITASSKIHYSSCLCFLVSLTFPQGLCGVETVEGKKRSKNQMISAVFAAFFFQNPNDDCNWQLQEERILLFLFSRWWQGYVMSERKRGSQWRSRNEEKRENEKSHESWKGGSRQP